MLKRKINEWSVLFKNCPEDSQDFESTLLSEDYELNETRRRHEVPLVFKRMPLMGELISYGLYRKFFASPLFCVIDDECAYTLSYVYRNGKIEVVENGILESGVVRTLPANCKVSVGKSRDNGKFLFLNIGEEGTKVEFMSAEQ